MTDPNNEQAIARAAVMECEQEIQTIKASLRKLSTSEADSPNLLEIFLVKTEGIGRNSSLKVNLQLSSPVEDATITEIYDQSKSELSDDAKATFRDVAVGVSTLTVSLVVDEKDMGSSAPHDLAPWCVVNAMDQNGGCENEVPIAIVTAHRADSGKVYGQDLDVSSERKELTEGDVVQPTCTLTFRLMYKPSINDRKEELYQLLNKKSEKKAAALENLRKISLSITRAGADGTTPKASSSAISKPSVKPGFLNKKKAETSKVRSFYEKAMGPDSLLRKSLGFLLLTKDYLIFFGAVSFFHFGGQFLALPAPA